MDSPAIGLAALCPLHLRNQNQHCDVRHRHITEIKNIHVLVYFDESTFFSSSYFEYSWTEPCEFSLQWQYVNCGRYYVYLPYSKYTIHAVVYCNKISIYVCMYVYRVTQKNGNFWKPQQKLKKSKKKNIDRNWTRTTCLLRDSNPNYQCLKITSCRWRPPLHMHSFTATTHFKNSRSFVSPCVCCIPCRMRLCRILRD